MTREENEILMGRNNRNTVRALTVCDIQLNTDMVSSIIIWLVVDSRRSLSE